MLRLIDLSHPLESGQPGFPGDPAISMARVHTVAGKGCNVSALSFSSHQGTHLDAPYHFFENGRTIDQMDLRLFYGPARLIDLAPGSTLPARTPLAIEHFLPHAAAFTAGARVIYRTGWNRAFGTAEFFTDFPSLTLEAAAWIAGRRIALLGMDTPTPSTEWLECHHILLGPGAEIVIVESLNGLEQLPPEFLFAGFPLNLKGGDGSPIRAVAIVGAGEAE
ncbi:MAG TPA: cyclase family protein [Chthoniobacteraceae bacterium]|jgi:kynurenine formamidase|nr:cyclase family protein [Chthoniobacteraceae bacterium]